MSAVIDMNAWKAAHAPKTGPTQRTTTEPPYCCMRCGSDLFRIFEGGCLRCGKCMAEIRNLRAT